MVVRSGMTNQALRTSAQVLSRGAELSDSRIRRSTQVRFVPYWAPADHTRPQTRAGHRPNPLRLPLDHRISEPSSRGRDRSAAVYVDRRGEGQLPDHLDVPGARRGPVRRMTVGEDFPSSGCQVRPSAAAAVAGPVRSSLRCGRPARRRRTTKGPLIEDETSQATGARAF